MPGIFINDVQLFLLHFRNTERFVTVRRKQRCLALHQDERLVRSRVAFDSLQFAVLLGMRDKYNFPGLEGMYRVKAVAVFRIFLD